MFLGSLALTTLGINVTLFCSSLTHWTVIYTTLLSDKQYCYGESAKGSFAKIQSASDDSSIDSSFVGTDESSCFQSSLEEHACK